jgi:hypothetical protein
MGRRNMIVKTILRLAVVAIVLTGLGLLLAGSSGCFSANINVEGNAVRINDRTYPPPE